MTQSSGTINLVTDGGNSGNITEDGSQANLEFINPRIPNVNVGERFEFMKIIQSTPNGEKVINILTTKLP